MAKSQKTVGAIAEIVPARVVAQAKALLTRAEKQLFDSSFGAALAKHSRAQVQSAVKQARALHAKWRGLAQGQARHTKRAGRNAASANARTREKQELLAGVVARLERRLDELKALVTAAAVPPAARRAKPTARTSNATAAATRSKKASRRVTSGLEPAVESQLVRLDRARQRSALTAAKASRILRGGQGTQRLGHVAASGRRAQRRRDIRSRG